MLVDVQWKPSGARVSKNPLTLTLPPYFWFNSKHTHTHACACLPGLMWAKENFGIENYISAEGDLKVILYSTVIGNLNSTPSFSAILFIVNRKNVEKENMENLKFLDFFILEKIRKFFWDEILFKKFSLSDNFALTVL